MRMLFTSFAALCCALGALLIPASAAVSPATGDLRGQNMGWVFIVLGVSLCVVVVLVLVSFLRRKK